jgi:hypothetical protein
MEASRPERAGLAGDASAKKADLTTTKSTNSVYHSTVVKISRMG